MKKEGMKGKKMAKKMPRAEMAKPMKNNFVSFKVKDSKQAGEVKMVNPKCANCGSY
jgi:hypothetical protein